MADLISGLGLLEKFSIIFPFLLILVLVYAVLGVTKVLGDNKGIHALIALAIAFITLFSTPARTIINLMAPWFVVLFIFLIFVLMAFRIFGDVDFMAVLGGESGKTIVYWIIAIALIIGLGSISYVVFGKGVPSSAPLPENQTAQVSLTPVPGAVATAGGAAFWSTLVHPQVLGLALILLIAMFTIQRLAGFTR